VTGFCISNSGLTVDLFESIENNPRNRLPLDGDVRYWGQVLGAAEADYYYSSFRENIEWRHDQAKMFGRHIVTKRKVAWYAERPFDYTYSNVTKRALPWTDDLIALKALMEKRAQCRFNACLLNLYHTGAEGMAWHSDAERELVQGASIGSGSLGAERRFSFKHKRTNEIVSVNLQHGSLLVMAGQTQRHWLHRLPPATRVHEPRINLTFRLMAESA